MGCLSNQTITTANWMFDFPRDVLGEHADPKSQMVADDLASKVAKRVFQQLSQAVEQFVMRAVFIGLFAVTLTWLIGGGWLTVLQTVLQVVAFILGLLSGGH